MRTDLKQTTAEAKAWAAEQGRDKVRGDATIFDQWKTLKAVALSVDQLVELNEVFTQENIIGFRHLLSRIEQELKIANMHLAAISELEVQEEDIDG